MCVKDFAQSLVYSKQISKEAIYDCSVGDKLMMDNYISVNQSPTLCWNTYSDKGTFSKQLFCFWTALFVNYSMWLTKTCVSITYP